MSHRHTDNRPSRLLAIGALAAVVALGACSASAPEPSPRTSQAASASASASTSTAIESPVSAEQLTKELVGDWFAVPIASQKYLVVFHPDGTLAYIDTVSDLVVNNQRLQTLPYRVDGNDLVAGGPTCFITARMHRYDDGQLRQDPEKFGSGCNSSSGEPEQQLTRLSPASAAGRSLIAPGQGGTAPVTKASDLEGVWVVSGFGEVFGFDERSGNRYVLDSTGQIDTSPDDKGAAAVGPAGTIVLTSANTGCQTPTTLTQATSGGTASDGFRSMHASVSSDSCQRFHGATEINLVQVL